LFNTPCRRKQLRDWAFPHTTDSHEAPGWTYEDDDVDDTTDFNLSLHMSTSIDEITDDIISRKSRPPSPAPRQDAPRCRHIAVTQHQAPSSSSSTDRGFVISKIFTQNVHGLRRQPKDKNGNICSTAPHDYTRYEHLIMTMKLKQLDVYFIQETWLEGDDVSDEVINGHHIFRHNGELGNHNFSGVAIILSPKYHEGWKAAGAHPPITTDATGEFAGRFISMNIKLASNDCVGKQVRKTTCPHPCLCLPSMHEDR